MKGKIFMIRMVATTVDGDFKGVTDELPNADALLETTREIAKFITSVSIDEAEAKKLAGGIASRVEHEVNVKELDGKWHFKITVGDCRKAAVHHYTLLKNILDTRVPDCLTSDYVRDCFRDCVRCKSGFQIGLLGVEEPTIIKVDDIFAILESLCGEAEKLGYKDEHEIAFRIEQILEYERLDDIKED